MGPLTDGLLINGGEPLSSLVCHPVSDIVEDGDAVAFDGDGGIQVKTGLRYTGDLVISGLGTLTFLGGTLTVFTPE